MGRPIKLIGYLCFLMALCSCKETKEQQISRLIHEWEGRTIVYPAGMTFSVLGKDSAGYSFPQNEYTIMTYVDSVGCTSCKLQLPTWKRLISMVDTVAAGKVSFLFVFHPKNKKEISFLLKRDRFLYPVFIDEKGDFDALNHFPSDVNFQTFLLDSQNKVLAIGNPVHNKRCVTFICKLLPDSKPESLPLPKQKWFWIKNSMKWAILIGKFPRPLLLVCGILAIIF